MITLEYYKKLLNWNEEITCNNLTDSKCNVVDTWRGLMSIANKKAVEVDRVAGEWIKIQNTNVASQLNKLKLFSNIFNKIIENKEIPDFWMKSKIILFRKKIIVHLK